MTKYTQLAYLAFYVNAEEKPNPVTFKTAYIPKSWHTEAETLFEKRKIRMNQRHWRTPVGALDNLLMACVPNVTCASNPAWENPTDKMWLYLRSEPTETIRLQNIMRRWARYRLMDDPFGPESETLLETMFRDQLQWKDMQFDPSECEIAPKNGTAKLHDYAYRLLPNVIAERLCNYKFQFGNEVTRFYRAPHSQSESEGSGNAIELIEWPPRTVSQSIQKNFWSLVVSISVHTVPFQPFVSIHCNLSVRRWIDIGFDQSLGRQKNVTAFLFYTAPQGLPCFLSARLKRRKNRSGKYEWDWSDYVNDLFPMGGAPQRIPEPITLMANPQEYIAENAIGVVYSQYIQQSVKAYHAKPHEAGTGFRPTDRHKLIEQIRKCLAPHYLQVPNSYLYTKSPGLFSFETNPLHTNIREKSKAKKAKESDGATKKERKTLSFLYSEARGLVGAQIEKHLTVLVLYQEPTCAERIVQVLCNLFGFDESQHPFFASDPNPTAEFTWESPEFALTILVIRLGELGAWDRPLELDASEENGAKRVQAVQIRALEIEKSAPVPRGACGAIIEIQPAESFEGETDPKQAIRLGLAYKGWVNQHIAYREPAQNRKAKSDEKQSAESAVFDLMRHLGIAPRFKQSKLRDDSLLEMEYIGVYVLKSGSDNYLPVCVRMSLTRMEITARARGQANWLPYRTFLTTLPRDGKPFLRSERRLLFDYLITLFDEQAQRDTLVMLHKNTLSDRGLWKWMNNDQITSSDELVMNDSVYPMQSHWNGRIRLAWIRDAGDDSQLPQCYTTDDNGLYGYGSGLYQLDERLFRSVAQKPKTQKNRSVEISKYDVGVRRSGPHKDEPLPPTPGDHAWNPIPLEILIAAMQKGDDAGKLAWAIHQLRSAFIHYEDQTILPAPLHFAKQAGQYRPLLLGKNTV